MEYYCTSDIGLVREKNQDAYLTMENSRGDFLALVADGIGGGRAGEVASRETIAYFEENFSGSGPFDSIDDAISYLQYHLEQCNIRVHELSLKNEKYAGMGTTLTGIMITKKGTISINCGDSRVYGFTDDMTCHLTKDHTLVNEMVEKGEITYEESLNHPKRHYLVRAIGVFDKVAFDVHKVRNMDYYLICSDGLHAYVSDDEIAKTVKDESMSVEEKVNALKQLALKKGGYDNITIILVKR